MIETILIIMTALFIINMAGDALRPQKVEAPLNMTSPSPLNYTTIRALWDCFDRFEKTFECHIDDLLYHDVLTQEDIEQAADELMMDKGFMTIDALRISPDDFKTIINNWVVYEWSTKPRAEQDLFIEMLVSLN